MDFICLLLYTGSTHVSTKGFLSLGVELIIDFCQILLVGHTVYDHRKVTAYLNGQELTAWAPFSYVRNESFS
jgi:hypothetical protein